MWRDAEHISKVVIVVWALGIIKSKMKAPNFQDLSARTKVTMSINSVQGDEIVKKFLSFLLVIFIFSQRNCVMEEDMKQVNISEMFMIVITRYG